MKVSLMITCLGDALFPEVGVATVKLLRRLGIEVDFPQAQTCCGQPHFNSGFHHDARVLARHAIKAFAGGQVVVTPSGSCAAMVKLEYPQLFHDDMVWHGRAEDLARRTHELSDFLVNVLGVEDVGAHFDGKVTYHMACHLRGLGLVTEPERLLKRVRGLTYVPLERYDECCGFGGSFAVRYPGISGAMVTDKASFIDKTGADVVVATDAGCIMNIAGCLHRRGSRVKFMHLAENFGGVFMKPTNWHRLFGLVLADFFTGSPFVVELEKDLSRKKQRLDIIILRRRAGRFAGRLPDGLDNLSTHNLITFKSHHETLDDWALKELTGHYVNYRKQASPSLGKLLPEREFRLYAICCRFPETSTLMERLFEGFKREEIGVSYTIEDFRREYVMEHFKDLTSKERLESLELLENLTPEELDEIEKYVQRRKHEATSGKKRKKNGPAARPRRSGGASAP